MYIYYIYTYIYKYIYINIYHQGYVYVFHFFIVYIHRKKRGSKAESWCELRGKVPVKFRDARHI